jgi:CDP-diacylglycerol--serine O-phosphatidyltransferase
MAANRSKSPTQEGGKPANSRFRKTIYLIPNLLTAANMVVGILSIAYSINDSLTLSLAAETKITPFVLPAKLILLAIILDFMDGRVARATGTTSKFGMEFDSLSDLVSFGMAPALLIYLSVLRYMTLGNMPLPVLGISIMILYVVCAAIRLARFNVQAQVEEKAHFVGLPSPAAAGMLASYVLFSRWGGWYGKGIILNKVMGWYEENISFVELTIIPVMTVLIAIVMVSTIAYPSLKKWKLETAKPWTFALIVLSGFWLFYAAEFTAFFLLLTYLLWGIARALTKKSVEKMKPKKLSAT